MSTNTITFQSNVNALDFPFIERILESLKATGTKVIKEETDDTLMTKKEFYSKIDKASSQKGKRITVEDFEAQESRKKETHYKNSFFSKRIRNKSYFGNRTS